MRCKFCDTKLESTDKIMLENNMEEMICPNCGRKFLFEMKEVDRSSLLLEEDQ